MSVETRPTSWPWAKIWREGHWSPALVVHWERGYPPDKWTWHARAIIVLDNGDPLEVLAPQQSVKRVG